jgi:hypothetical protein
VASIQRIMQMAVNPEPFMTIGGGTIVVLNRPD